ncbi:WecB/TagA/CpsF family glycosyltransferase [Tepidibacter formicigenes]|uniref:N-acetylglucosaminyldiphosphoundecaprenol N-acetyl-beta-D-mannosaminyltransferase n=1 Tax=Tepidibacter formicigenes DSM 15518 TaxID=1123349 RepID=A0A1M6QDH9_9FIRM|nr:WecB/TagA/CpsF family glycosyltransferase [Tepidibacter formicigenes]SHK18309.1 N-acetylglucosaminyldiphosphoundecaprenol N-acetyl-beta-D-mannosaminyltransferase [Tepidibacter formicigenes DSM 15518]
MVSKSIPKLKTCNILGVNINVTNMKETVEIIKDNLDKIKGDYICVSNVHTTVMSYEDENYKAIQNGGFMALPDGKPLSIISKKRGFKEAERVTGPDLMEEIFKISEENEYRHYFYGSTQETLDTLKRELNKKYPKLNIVGMHSPPFRKLTEEEGKEIVENINKAKPDFIWVGLGAPKQEIWMHEHENKVNGLMIGVGAGFDYHAGNISRAPKWMQNMSLEWLYRLLQDPKRLMSRYINTNLKFIYYIIRRKW